MPQGVFTLRRLVVISIALLMNSCELDRGPGEVPRAKAGGLTATQEWFYGDDCNAPKRALVVTDEFISALNDAAIEWSSDPGVKIDSGKLTVRRKEIVRYPSSVSKITIEHGLEVTVQTRVMVASDSPLGERKIYLRLHGRNLGIPCITETHGKMKYDWPNTLALSIQVPSEGPRAWGNWLGRIAGLLFLTLLGLLLLAGIVVGVFDWVKKKLSRN